MLFGISPSDSTEPKVATTLPFVIPSVAEGPAVRHSL
jgi:hypothetical protein